MLFQFEHWRIYLFIYLLYFILVYTTAVYYDEIKDYYNTNK